MNLNLNSLCFFFLEVKKAISVLSSKKARATTSKPKRKAATSSKKKKVVKSKKPAKSKERRKVEKDLDEMEIVDSDEDEEQQKKQKAEVFDDLSQNSKRGKQGGELTQLQTGMQTHLHEIIDLVVGRIHVDPARLQAPPPQFAARVLYADHLQKLRLHFLTGGTFVAQKDFILFLQEVLNLNLNSFENFL